MVDALVKTYRFEGIRGLYKGFLPGVLGVSHGALQFMAYEEMKNSFNNYRKMPIDTKLVHIPTRANHSSINALTCYFVVICRAHQNICHSQLCRNCLQPLRPIRTK